MCVTSEAPVTCYLQIESHCAVCGIRICLGQADKGLTLGYI